MALVNRQLTSEYQTQGISISQAKDILEAMLVDPSVSRASVLHAKVDEDGWVIQMYVEAGL